jgi:predicted  nucleic acid-binding Zn-ribbon protein
MSEDNRGLLEALDEQLDAPEPAVETPKSAAPETKTAPVAETAPQAAPEPKTLENKIDIPDDVIDQLTRAGETEKKAEPEAEPELPKDAPKAAQTAFAKVTTELRETRARLKELENKIGKEEQKIEDDGEETSPELEQLKAELETIRSQRDEYETELSVSRVQATRQYKVAVQKPIEQAVTGIEEIAKAFEIDSDALVRAANIGDSAKRRAAVKDLVAQLDPVDAVDLRRRVEDLNQLYGKRDIILQNAEKAMEEIGKREAALESERLRQAEEAQGKEAAVTKAAYDEIWNRFTNEVPVLRKTGNPNWDSRIDDIRTQALYVVNTDLDAETRAALTFQAVSMPLLIELFQGYIRKSQAEISGLKKSLGEMRGATPGAGGGEAKTGSPDLSTDMGFLEALEKGINTTG